MVQNIFGISGYMICRGSPSSPVKREPNSLPGMSELGHNRKSSVGLGMSVVGGKAEVDFGRLNVCL